MTLTNKEIVSQAEVGRVVLVVEFQEMHPPVVAHGITIAGSHSTLDHHMKKSIE